MTTTCHKCHQEYDDTYHSTQCPHEYFQMHTGVFVNGQNGCAHTIEELNKATNENILPNPDCEYMLGLEGLREAIERGMTVNRAVDATNAEVVANSGFLPEESCHFGDCKE